MSMFTLAISCLTTYDLPWFMDGPNIPSSYAILFFTAADFTFTTRHSHTWTLFPLWLSLFILSEAISPLFSSSILDTYQPGGVHLSVSYLFCVFILFVGSSRQEYSSGLPSIPQWTTFCQNSPPWPVCLGWPNMAWLIVSLSYTRLWFMWSVWLVFCYYGLHSLCPLMNEAKRLVEASWMEGVAVE